MPTVRTILIGLLCASVAACVGGVRGGGSGSGGSGGSDVGPAPARDVGPPVVDLGPPIVDAGHGARPDVTTSDAGLTFGQPCQAMGDCNTGICAHMGSYTLCSRYCDEHRCPRDFDCRVGRFVDGREAEICYFDGQVGP